MKKVKEYTDKRLKNACAQCGRALRKSNRSSDHVPSKCLLRRSQGSSEGQYPLNPPVAYTCRECNQKFSKDEEYFCVFLNCLLAGSTEPDVHVEPRVQRALKQHAGLRARIEAAKRSEILDGKERVIWIPELARVHRVVVKNARGHAFYEYGELVLEEPKRVSALPLDQLTPARRLDFETAPSRVAGWPEVGSRMMQRLATGQDMDHGWVVVQPSVYRYRVEHEDGLVVSAVLRNYLATEVHWG